MRIALTGTPGTGKTAVAALLPFRVIDLNAVVRDEGLSLGTDEDRGCLIADVDALAERLEDLAPEEDEEIVVLEGHFSHHFASEAIVLRTRPKVLRVRLARRSSSVPCAMLSSAILALMRLRISALAHMRLVAAFRLGPSRAARPL